MKILGIDEAGRGPVVGPMVIAGAMYHNEEELRELGVKDSKILTPEKREELYEKLIKMVKYKVVILEPDEIDARVGVTNLNLIEASKFAEIIDEMKPDKVIIDTPTRNTEKFKRLMESLVNHKCEIVCENFADVNYPIVSAASIIAKVNRDRLVKQIEKETGEKIGVGYPHDPDTIKFVEKAVKDPKLRKYVRQSWSTYKRILEEKSQVKLGEFYEESN